MFGSFPRIVVIRITFPVDVVFYLVDENNESVPSLIEINSLFTFPSGEVLLLRIESTINSDLIWSRSISNHKNIEFVLTFVFINLLSHTHTHTILCHKVFVHFLTKNILDSKLQTNKKAETLDHFLRIIFSSQF